jgi:subtilisin family serine protease
VADRFGLIAVVNSFAPPPDNQLMDPLKTIPRTAALAVLAAALWLVTPASGQRGREITLFAGHEAASREVLVKFRNSRANVDAEVKQQVDVEDDRPVGNDGVRRLRSRTFDVETLVHFLQSHPDVEYAEPNYIVHSTAVPNDPLFGSLWGLRNLGQVVNGTSGVPGADIGAVNAWDISTGSTASVVGIIDTGINYSHPDLSANMWTAPAQFTVTVGGSNVTCAAGTFGFNAINRTCNPMDDNHHGSHTAGTVGARGNNGAGVAGVNWTARLMGLKFLDSTGSGALSDAVDAIEFAIQTKARFGSAANVRILSNSWGGTDFSQTLLNEVNRANTNDMLFVAAAGNGASNNDTTPFYPARFSAPNVIAVAATDSSDQLAGFSNWGHTTVHLGAPGVNILSTSLGSTYEYLNGTSMATPHVAGAAALVLSRCALSTADLKTNLLSNVDPIASLTNLTITGGRLNVNKAIRSCLPAAPSAFSKSAPANGTTGQPIATTLSWTASSGATSYEYCVDTTNNSSCDGSWTSTGTAQSAAPSGLAVNTTYYWQVRARNATATTDADLGAWWSFTTQPTTQSWFDPNWAFRRPVVVGNTTGGALANYQVQVTLDATTFDFSRAQSDGRDLRVTDATGTVTVPFWIDAWNAAAQRATIWVKLPTLPTAGATIYLYYGNAAASSTTGSGTATFDLYDGFEGLAVGSPPGGSGTLTWTYGGSLTAAATPVHLGTRSLQQQNPTQLTSAFPALTQGVIGAWVQRPTATAGDDDIYLYTNGALAATIGLGSSSRFHYWNGAFQDTAVAWTPGTWYLITATFDTTQRRFDFAVFDANGVLVVRVPGLAFAPGSGGLSSALFYTSSAFTGTAYLDDIRLLRWTATEATTAIGAEEVRSATSL